MRRTNDTHLLYPPAVVIGHHSLYRPGHPTKKLSFFNRG